MFERGDQMWSIGIGIRRRRRRELQLEGVVAREVGAIQHRSVDAGDDRQGDERLRQPLHRCPTRDELPRAELNSAALRERRWLRWLPRRPRRWRWHRRRTLGFCLRALFIRRLRQPWPQGPISARHDQQVHGHFALFPVGDQLEAFGEHALHHEAHLGTRRRSRRRRYDVELLGGEQAQRLRPGRQEAQRERERLEQSADRISANLRGALAQAGDRLAVPTADAAVGRDAVLLSFTASGMDAAPKERLLYYPAAAPAAEKALPNPEEPRVFGRMMATPSSPTR